MIAERIKPVIDSMLKKIFSLILIAICTDILAQPANLEGNWSGSWSSNNGLTDRGVIRSVRVQSGITGNAEYLFNTAATNYNPQWTGSNAPNFSRTLDTKLSGAAFYYTGGGWNSNLQSSLTNGYYYTFIIGENSSSNNDMSVIETNFNPVSISAVNASPSGNPYIGQNVVVSITTGSTPDANEYLYVRYTTNNWAGSSFVQATGSGTSWTATIPFQPGGTTVQYYVLSTKSTLSLTHADADYQTLELNNNGGANWTYTQQNVYGNLAAGGACDGTFDDPDCWINGAVPLGNTSVAILNTMAMDVSDTVSQLTISSGATFTLNTGITLNLPDGGSLSNGGTFTAGSGSTVKFLGSAGITGTFNFENVSISGAVNFGSGSTITSTGKLTLLNGGSVNSNAPKYNTGSILEYNTGGSYNRGLEWGYTGIGTPGTDAGYPNKVEVNSGTLNIAGSTNGVARACGGTLTIAGSAAVTMSAMTASFTVIGNLTNGGSLTLSSAVGGDLYLRGAFINNGTFIHNDREVVFEGTTTQSVSGTLNNSGGSQDGFSYLRMNKSSGSISLGNDIFISNRVQFDAGSIILNSSNVTLGSGLTITGTPNDSKMFITNGSGQLSKIYSGTGSFTYPIGTATEYTPLTLNFTSGTFSSAFASARSLSSKHASNSSTADYLERSWTISQSGITSFNCDITCIYVDDDVVGSESNIYSGKYSGGTWIPGAAADTASNTLTFSGATSFSDITGGELNALPIQLLSFKARSLSDKSVLITWETASEFNNSHFELEKILGLDKIETIAHLPGAGNSNTKLTYSALDRTPNSLNIYQLKQVDMDGRITLYGPISFETDRSMGILVYPNPATDFLHIQFPEFHDQPLKASLFDARGKLLSVYEQLTNQAMDIRELPSGIYFIHVQSGHQTTTLRWTKSR